MDHCLMVRLITALYQLVLNFGIVCAGTMPLQWCFSPWLVSVVSTVTIPRRQCCLTGIIGNYLINYVPGPSWSGHWHLLVHRLAIQCQSITAVLVHAHSDTHMQAIKIPLATLTGQVCALVQLLCSDLDSQCNK